MPRIPFTSSPMRPRCVDIGNICRRRDIVRPPADLWPWHLLGKLWYISIRSGCSVKLVCWRKGMAFFANWIILLKPTGNSVSSYTWFVVLRCLAPKLFNPKLSILYLGKRLLSKLGYLSIRSGYTVKPIWWGKRLRSFELNHLTAIYK